MSAWLRRHRIIAGLVLLLLLLGVAIGWDTARCRLLDVPDHDAFVAFLAASKQQDTYRAFGRHLDDNGVGAVVEPWQLWRQGDEWRPLGAPPFAAPPRDQWPAIVATLALVRDRVIPIVGPVEVVSGYRTEAYNARAGGAGGSRHRAFEALDLVPRGFFTRWGLRARLTGLWIAHGEAAHMGLGLYAGTRFHVDTHRYRRW